MKKMKGFNYFHKPGLLILSISSIDETAADKKKNGKPLSDIPLKLLSL
jgi:hypothetical protein